MVFDMEMIRSTAKLLMLSNAAQIRFLTRISLSLFLFVSCLATFAGAQTNPSNDQQLQYATFEGHRVHYKNWGRGEEALIFVHGWACDESFWTLQISAFKEKLRIISIDLPGHGQSDKPEIPYTQDLFARSINAVITDSGVKRGVLVGHSMGVPTVRQFYRHFPKKTLALVFVDGSLRPTASKESTAKFIDSLRGSNFQNVIAASARGLVGPQIPKALRLHMTSVMVQTPQHVAASSAEGMMDSRVWLEDKIEVPVLAIFARSPVWKEDNESFYRSLAPNLDYQMWEGVGHFLMVEKAIEFNETLRSFLETIEFLKKKKEGNLEYNKNKYWPLRYRSNRHFGG